ncbi:MAG: hypothetical protein EXR72_02120 [Myxococcales bacterium]|nr:hypothetical protein [Myxococcales bacterium]
MATAATSSDRGRVMEGDAIDVREWGQAFPQADGCLPLPLATPAGDGDDPGPTACPYNREPRPGSGHCLRSGRRVPYRWRMPRMNRFAAAVEAASRLSARERARFARDLIDGLGQAPVKTATEGEVRRRIDEIRSGAAATVSWEDTELVPSAHPAAVPTSSRAHRVRIRFPLGFLSGR